MSTIAQLPAELRAALPANQALTALEAGAPYACVLADDPEERAAALTAVLNGVDVDRTRIIGVSNPLNAPLTFERLLFQAVGPKSDLHLDDPSVVVGLLASAAGSADHLILAIEQADTLEEGALRSLVAILPEFRSITPTLQILFVGSPAFDARLQSAGDEASFGDETAPPPTSEGRDGRGPIKYAVGVLLVVIVGGLAAARISNPDLLWPRLPVASQPVSLEVPAAPAPAAGTAIGAVPVLPPPAPQPPVADTGSVPAAGSTNGDTAAVPGASMSPVPSAAAPQAPAPVSTPVPQAAGAPSPMLVPVAPMGAIPPEPARVTPPSTEPAGSRGPASARITRVPAPVSSQTAPAPPSHQAPSTATKPSQQATTRHGTTRLTQAQKDEAETRRLRRNFNQFLARSPDGPIGLSQAEKEVLFQEYLERHRGEGAPASQ